MLLSFADAIIAAGDAAAFADAADASCHAMLRYAIIDTISPLRCYLPMLSPCRHADTMLPLPRCYA